MRRTTLVATAAARPARGLVITLLAFVAVSGASTSRGQSSASAFAAADSSRPVTRAARPFVWTDSLRRIAEGRAPEEPEGRRRLISFDPHPSSRCASFLIMETTGSYLGNEEHKIDQWLITDGLGLMVNAGGWALGGAGELRFARGHFDAVPSLRLRRWLVGDQSLEVSLEYTPRGEEWPSTRLVGPAASLRYAFNPYAFVQVGTCRFRETTSVFTDPETGVQRSDGREFTRNYVGLGLSGRSGAGMWGLQVALGGLAFLVIAALSGMTMS